MASRSLVRREGSGGSSVGGGSGGGGGNDDDDSSEDEEESAFQLMRNVQLEQLGGSVDDIGVEFGSASGKRVSGSPIGASAARAAVELAIVAPAPVADASSDGHDDDDGGGGDSTNSLPALAAVAAAWQKGSLFSESDDPVAAAAPGMALAGMTAAGAAAVCDKPMTAAVVTSAAEMTAAAATADAMTDATADKTALPAADETALQAAAVAPPAETAAVRAAERMPARIAFLMTYLCESSAAEFAVEQQVGAAAQKCTDNAVVYNELVVPRHGPALALEALHVVEKAENKASKERGPAAAAATAAAAVGSAWGAAAAAAGTSTNPRERASGASAFGVFGSPNRSRNGGRRGSSAASSSSAPAGAPSALRLRQSCSPSLPPDPAGRGGGGGESRAAPVPAAAVIPDSVFAPVVVPNGGPNVDPAATAAAAAVVAAIAAASAEASEETSAAAAAAAHLAAAATTATEESRVAGAAMAAAGDRPRKFQTPFKAERGNGGPRAADATKDKGKGKKRSRGQSEQQRALADTAGPTDGGAATVRAGTAAGGAAAPKGKKRARKEEGSDGRLGAPKKLRIVGSKVKPSLKAEAAATVAAAAAEAEAAAVNAATGVGVAAAIPAAAKPLSTARRQRLMALAGDRRTFWAVLHRWMKRAPKHNFLRFRGYDGRFQFPYVAHVPLDPFLFFGAVIGVGGAAALEATAPLEAVPEAPPALAAGAVGGGGSGSGGKKVQLKSESGEAEPWTRGWEDLFWKVMGQAGLPVAFVTGVPWRRFRLRRAYMDTLFPFETECPEELLTVAKAAPKGEGGGAADGGAAAAAAAAANGGKAAKAGKDGKGSGMGTAVAVGSSGKSCPKASGGGGSSSGGTSSAGGGGGGGSGGRVQPVDYVRCICGHHHENPPRHGEECRACACFVRVDGSGGATGKCKDGQAILVGCGICGVWQHSMCIGDFGLGSRDPDELKKMEYLCELCRVPAAGAANAAGPAAGAAATAGSDEVSVASAAASPSPRPVPAPFLTPAPVTAVPRFARFELPVGWVTELVARKINADGGCKRDPYSRSSVNLFEVRSASYRSQPEINAALAAMGLDETGAWRTDHGSPPAATIGGGSGGGRGKSGGAGAGITGAKRKRGGGAGAAGGGGSGAGAGKKTKTRVDSGKGKAGTAKGGGTNGEGTARRGCVDI